MPKTLLAVGTDDGTHASARYHLAHGLVAHCTLTRYASGADTVTIDLTGPLTLPGSALGPFLARLQALLRQTPGTEKECPA